MQLLLKIGFKSSPIANFPGALGDFLMSRAHAHALSPALRVQEPTRTPERANPGGAAEAVAQRWSWRHVGPGSGRAAVVVELLRLGSVEVESCIPGHWPCRSPPGPQLPSSSADDLSSPGSL